MNKISKNTQSSTSAKSLTKEQIYLQITELQGYLSSMEDALEKLQCVSESAQTVKVADGNVLALEYFPDVALEKIKSIKELLLTRERTLQMMIDFYLRIYGTIENAG